MSDRSNRYFCVQCGALGLPDAFTKIDSRYALGACTGDHKGVQYLAREDVLFTEKKKPRRTASP